MADIILDTDRDHVLVALMPSPKDMDIARTKGWYRMPVTQRSPAVVRDGTATAIAFYQPGSFGDDRYVIRWYSQITSTVIRKRIEVLPNEALDPNAQRDHTISHYGSTQRCTAIFLPDDLLAEVTRMLRLPSAQAKSKQELSSLAGSGGSVIRIGIRSSSREQPR